MLHLKRDTCDHQMNQRSDAFLAKVASAEQLIGYVFSGQVKRATLTCFKQMRLVTEVVHPHAFVDHSQ